VGVGELVFPPLLLEHPVRTTAATARAARDVAVRGRMVDSREDFRVAPPSAGTPVAFRVVVGGDCAVVPLGHGFTTAVAVGLPPGPERVADP
jgi:hypothetical protein